MVTMGGGQVPSVCPPGRRLVLNRRVVNPLAGRNPTIFPSWAYLVRAFFSPVAARRGESWPAKAARAAPSASHHPLAGEGICG